VAPWLRRNFRWYWLLVAGPVCLLQLFVVFFTPNRLPWSLVGPLATVLIFLGFALPRPKRDEL
jgi:hypothetical protein